MYVNDTPTVNGQIDATTADISTSADIADFTILGTNITSYRTRQLLTQEQAAAILILLHESPGGIQVVDGESLTICITAGADVRNDVELYYAGVLKLETRKHWNLC